MLGDNGNKCTTWGMGKVMCMWEQGVYRKSLYMPLNFAVNLNCSKNKGLKKNEQIQILHTYFSKDKIQIGKNICNMLNVINIIQIKVHLYINKKGTQ